MAGTAPQRLTQARCGQPATMLLAGRYRLLGQVGRGGVADVYAACDEVLHRRVAVKLFRVDGAVGDDRRRADAEVRIVAGLRHPGLVTVFDSGTVSGQPDSPDSPDPFIVMELIDGPTLRQVIAEGPLPPRDVALLGAELAAALAYVHRQGVTHRDVKPANVLLDVPVGESGPFAAKLTDFGIARVVDSTRLTAVGMTVGTANYLSPEQATGRPTGPSSDVYSLGLVLLECLTGKVVYPGSGVMAALARLHAQPVVPLAFGPRWSRLLTMMTARDPAARPGAAQVARELSALVGDEASAPHAEAAATAPALALPEPGEGRTMVLPGQEPAKSGWWRSRWSLLGASVALALLAVIVALSQESGSGQPATTPTPPAASPATALVANTKPPSSVAAPLPSPSLVVRAPTAPDTGPPGGKSHGKGKGGKAGNG